MLGWWPMNEAMVVMGSCAGGHVIVTTGHTHTHTACDDSYDTIYLYIYCS